MLLEYWSKPHSYKWLANQRFLCWFSASGLLRLKNDQFLLLIVSWLTPFPLNNFLLSKVFSVCLFTSWVISHPRNIRVRKKRWKQFFMFSSSWSFLLTFILKWGGRYHTVHSQKIFHYKRPKLKVQALLLFIENLWCYHRNSPNLGKEAVIHLVTVVVGLLKRIYNLIKRQPA